MQLLYMDTVSAVVDSVSRGGRVHLLSEVKWEKKEIKWPVCRWSREDRTVFPVSLNLHTHISCCLREACLMYHRVTWIVLPPNSPRNLLLLLQSRALLSCCQGRACDDESILSGQWYQLHCTLLPSVHLSPNVPSTVTTFFLLAVSFCVPNVIPPSHSTSSCEMKVDYD